ncbi:Integron-associated effector binding protein [anaerobic digester metagenome]
MNEEKYFIIRHTLSYYECYTPMVMKIEYRRKQMNYKIVTLGEKKVVGVAARTGNMEPDMQTVIGGLWQQFYQGNVCEKIEVKVSDYAYGIYSDYKGETYQVTVGAEVSEFSENEGLISLIIPKGRYAKFQIVGDMVKDVANAWVQIWQMDLKRIYTADFEEYVAYDGTNSTVNIYIAVEE